MSNNLKSSYNVDHRVESFFTGTQLLFDQSGNYFYCSNGPVVNKVSVEDGQVKAQITTKNDGDNVIRFTLSSNDKLIVIAYYSGLIAKFNLVDDTIEREFKSIHSAPIAQLKINSTDTLLATASSDGTVKLWNLQHHYCSQNLKGVNGVVSAIEFYNSQKGELLICSAGDDCIHIFDLATSKRIAKLSKHCSTITDIKISSNGEQMVSVGRDKIAVIWNLVGDDETFGRPIRTIPIYESTESVVVLHARLLSSVINHDIADDRMIFATIGEEGRIKFWDAQSGSLVLTQNQEPLSGDRCPNNMCIQLSIRPNYDQLCAVSAERDVFFYQLPNLELRQQLQGHLDEVLSACWFAKDQYLAIACNSNDLKVMEVSTSKCQHLSGHTDIVVCVRAVPCDPMCIISSSKDCSILVWKFEPTSMTPQVIYKASGHTHAVYALGLSPYERIFFSGGEDTTIKKWEFPKDKDGLNECASLVARSTIKAHDARIDSIDVSPNDQLVASGSRDKTAKIFSASNLQIIATLKGHRRGVNAVQFSPVDQVIVTAADLSLRMWNLQDFTCVKTFQGHDCTVLNFAFLSTGLQMLSVGSDGNAKLWNCKLNECIKTIDAHSGNAWSLALTSDDSKMITGGDDEKLIIWRDTTEEEREERLTNLQTRVVQEQDFMNYINKKKWRKALKMALNMENQAKTLIVMREILLEPDGSDELEEILVRRTLDQINFMVECCVSWISTAKNSSLGQLVLNIILRQFDNQQLLKLSSFNSSMEQLRILTEKSFNRCEGLVQQATFVDFLMNSMRIQ